MFNQPINKYGNKKVEFDGVTFDSRKEAKRYAELKLLLRAGQITDLELQKEFVLIPKLTVNGKTERAVKYKADFVYKENGELVVEDAKGMRTKEYIIKRKLMLFIHNIVIKEV